WDGGRGRLGAEVGEQLLEVRALADRVEVGVPGHVVGVPEARGDGLAEQLDGPGREPLALLHILAARHGVDTGEVVPLVGGPARALRQFVDLNGSLPDPARPGERAGPPGPGRGPFRGRGEFHGPVPVRQRRRGPAQAAENLGSAPVSVAQEQAGGGPPGAPPRPGGPRGPPPRRPRPALRPAWPPPWGPGPGCRPGGRRSGPGSRGCNNCLPGRPGSRARRGRPRPASPRAPGPGGTRPPPPPASPAP